jgi:beta-glucosidase
MADSLLPEGLSEFPADFIWGSATAAYQIEGATHEGGRGPSIWDTFAATPGRTHLGETGDIADDHYHRWEGDLDLMVELGIPAYRFSVSWSRLQPSGRGELNPEGVAFYRALLQGLRNRGIRPFVTLYHWDLPQPLEDAGGWPVRATAEAFGAYAPRVVEALGDLADDWITLNEPWCSSFLGYGYGRHAPGRSDIRLAVAATHHLLLAHGLAVAGIRQVKSDAQLGITNIIQEFVPASDSEADRGAAARLDAVSNRVFLEPVYQGGYSAGVRALLDPLGLSEVLVDGDEALIGAPTDFAGINHYQRVLVADSAGSGPFSLTETAAEPATTSFGWSVIPESLENVLKRVAEITSLPIYITESGASYDDELADDGTVDDPERVDYLRGYFGAAARAIASGVDLRGYFVWSLLDNYEWAEGYSKRFGIVYVDYPTQRRIPKSSARWYRDTIAAHSALVTFVPHST